MMMGRPESPATALLTRVAEEPTYLMYQTVARELRALGPQALEIPSTRHARVALIGTGTLEPLASYLLVEAAQEQIWLDIWCGGYNQFQSELLDANGRLYAFAPELVVVAAAAAGIVAGASDGSASEPLITRINELSDAFTRHSKGLLIWHNLVVPSDEPYRLDPSPAATLTTQLNAMLATRCAQHPQLRVLDLDRLAAFFGKQRMCDERLKSVAQIPWAPEFMRHLARAMLAFVKAYKGLTRKCVVVDLDNTLWGGVVGEDGPDALVLGDDGPGTGYVAFQRALLDLRARGILLAINSKNNPADALAVLRSHPGMVLREHHVAAMRINWQDKATNMQALAAELNLGLDSLVFIDDQPFERELMRHLLPQVLTPDWPTDPLEYASALSSLTDFERLQTTEEDQRRAELYAAEQARQQTQAQTCTLEDYLKSLEIVISVQRMQPAEVARVAQLTQKTNQFNLTTRRYQQRDIQDLLESSTARVYTLRVQDRFGDAGLVGVAIVRMMADVWELDTLLMSCRVMGRRIEFAFLGALCQAAQAAGGSVLVGRYAPTAKNHVVKGLFAQAGFEPAGQKGETIRWQRDLARPWPEEPLIRVDAAVEAIA